MTYTTVQLNQVRWASFQAARKLGSVIVRLRCLTCDHVVDLPAYSALPAVLRRHRGHDTDIDFRPIWRRGLAPWFNWLEVSLDGKMLPCLALDYQVYK